MGRRCPDWSSTSGDLMTRRSNTFTVAVLDLPSWADYTALPAGKFIEFTLNTPEAIGMTRSTIYNGWGGAFVPAFAARGGAGYAGGANHTSWVDSRADAGIGQSGAYVLDCDTRLYSRKCYPTADNFGALPSGSGMT